MRNRSGMEEAISRDLGFSLLELLIVLAITLVVGAMAAPRFTTMIVAYRLKSTAAGAAGMLQQSRMASVRTNTPIEARSVMSGGLQQLYVDLNGNTQIDPGEPTVVMPKNVSLQTSGSPQDLGTTLATSGQLYYTTNPRFNPRGLPCVMVGAVCKNVDASNKQVGFVYYLKSDNLFGQTAWAAVTVTPAGRIKTWVYTGSQYK